MADVPYVGSGVLGSALAIDKLAAKEIAAHHGLPQARYRGFHADQLVGGDSEGHRATLESLLSELGPRVFVKPANLGSSVGVAPADDVTSLDAALADAASYDEWVVVEEAVTGREIELAVLGDRVPQVSGPGEIRPGDAFYEGSAKKASASSDGDTAPGQFFGDHPSCLPDGQAVYHLVEKRATVVPWQ